MQQLLHKLDSRITHTYQQDLILLFELYSNTETGGVVVWPNSAATVTQELEVIIYYFCHTNAYTILWKSYRVIKKRKKYNTMLLWTAMTDETAAGKNAAENIMKKYSKVNVSHRYRTKISKNVIKERNLKHDQGHKRYRSRV